MYKQGSFKDKEARERTPSKGYPQTCKLTELVLSLPFSLVPPHNSGLKNVTVLPTLKQACLGSKHPSCYLLAPVVYRTAGRLQVASLQHVTRLPSPNISQPDLSPENSQVFGGVGGWGMMGRQKPSLCIWSICPLIHHSGIQEYKGVCDF